MSNVANATPTRTGGLKGNVSRGARGVHSKLGITGDWGKVSVRRTIPGRRLGVTGPTFDNLNGGRKITGYSGRLRSGSTTSL